MTTEEKSHGVTWYRDDLPRYSCTAYGLDFVLRAIGVFDPNHEQQPGEYHWTCRIRYGTDYYEPAIGPGTIGYAKGQALRSTELLSLGITTQGKQPAFER